MSRRVTIESVLESHGPCESLELSIVRIGLETTEIQRTKCRLDSRGRALGRESTGAFPRERSDCFLSRNVRPRSTHHVKERHTRRRARREFFKIIILKKTRFAGRDRGHERRARRFPVSARGVSGNQSELTERDTRPALCSKNADPKLALSLRSARGSFFRRKNAAPLQERGDRSVAPRKKTPRRARAPKQRRQRESGLSAQPRQSLPLSARICVSPRRPLPIWAMAKGTRLVRRLSLSLKRQTFVKQSEKSPKASLSSPATSSARARPGDTRVEKNPFPPAACCVGHAQLVRGLRERDGDAALVGDE